jgi:hypothetical protein
MPFNQSMYERKTFKYRPGWAGLDRSEYVGTVKVLAPTKIEEPSEDDDISCGPVYRFRVVARSADKGKDFTAAIEDTLGGSSCQHEYDCCGCVSRFVRARRVSAREYAVIQSTSYNY